MHSENETSEMSDDERKQAAKVALGVDPDA